MKYSGAKVLLASFGPPATSVMRQTKTEMIGNRLNFTIDTYSTIIGVRRSKYTQNNNS